VFWVVFYGNWFSSFRIHFAWSAPTEDFHPIKTYSCSRISDYVYVIPCIPILHPVINPSSSSSIPRNTYIIPSLLIPRSTPNNVSTAPVIAFLFYFRMVCSSKWNATLSPFKHSQTFVSCAYQRKLTVSEHGSLNLLWCLVCVVSCGFSGVLPFWCVVFGVCFLVCSVWVVFLVWLCA